METLDQVKGREDQGLRIISQQPVTFGSHVVFTIEVEMVVFVEVMIYCLSHIYNLCVDVFNYPNL